MPRLLVRYGVPAMVLGLLGALLYALTSASATRAPETALERMAVGPLAKLDFAFAGEEAGVREVKTPDGETVKASVGFVSPEGGPASLEDFRGKTTLVNFWATWCPPCEREMPSLAALHTARGGEDFQVVAISVDDPGQSEAAREKLNQLSGGVLDFYHSPDFAIAYGVGARGFPTTILLDPEGREIARLAGEANWSAYETVAFIDKAVAQAGG